MDNAILKPDIITEHLLSNKNCGKDPLSSFTLMEKFTNSAFHKSERICA